MALEIQHQPLDEAFVRIEETILPCIAMVLDSLLDAAEAGESGLSPHACAAELRTLALQLESLTSEIEQISPAYLGQGAYRKVDAA